MTSKELASELQEKTYEFFHTSEYKELVKKAKESDLVIIRGYSDDNIEIEGALEFEIPYGDSTKYFLLNDKSKLEEYEVDEGNDELDDLLTDYKKVNIKLDDDFCLSFSISNITNYKSFDIWNTEDREDGSYCMGYVVDLAELKCV